MFKHVRFKGVLALAVPAVAALALAIGASATPALNLSFSASSDGASAGWSSGKGSPIDLTLGSTSDSFAEITLHHVAGTAVGALPEPTFSTDNYNSGSPRYYITLSNGHSLWGYPPNAGLSNSPDFAWAIDNGNTYESWSGAQSAEDDATVTGAYVIADADQSAGTVDEISGLTFAGNPYN
jgi:hypothetical protein